MLSFLNNYIKSGTDINSVSTQLFSVPSLSYTPYVFHSFLNISALASSTQVPLTTPPTLPLTMLLQTNLKGTRNQALVLRSLRADRAFKPDL